MRAAPTVLAGVIAIIAASALAGGPTPAAAGSCRASMPTVDVETPEVSVSSQDVRSVIDYTVFPWQTQNQLAPGWSINGLTVAKPVSTYRIESLTGSGCFSVTRVQVIFTYEDPVKVYVADKYAPGTCEHQVITAHEMQHVDIFRRGRQIYAERMRQVVWNAAVQSTGKSEAETNAALTDAVETVTREFNKALGTAHGAIDTVENYRVTQALCRNW